MLNFYKLEIFAAIAEAGSFSAAGLRLHMSQSAVSQHMQDLEASLGTRLFKRERRGVSLTPAGVTLYDYTRQILRLVAAAENAVTDVDNLAEGEISLGATPGISIYALPDWVSRFRRRYPQFTIALHTDITPRIVAAVLERSLELGFVEGELERWDSSKLAWLPLAELAQFVIVGQQHDWWAEDSVSAAALSSQPFISRQQNSQTRLWLEDLLGGRGISLRTIAALDHPEAIKQMVAAGEGITILPAFVVQRELEQGTLRALPVHDLPMQRTLKLIWERERPRNPITRTFLRVLTEQYPQVAQVVEEG